MELSSVRTKLDLMLYLSENTLGLLQEYEVDRYNGFLPPVDPIESLPLKYQAWDDLNRQLVKVIQQNTLIEAIEHLPLIKVGKLSKSELERAMLLLSGFAHSYISISKKDVIPPQIAIPWFTIANRLGRLPIISHASLVLNNWRRIDKTKPFSLSNIDTILKMQGSKDEAWFFLATTNIEKIGAPAIALLIEGVQCYRKGNLVGAIEYLKAALPILKKLPKAMQEMYKHCNPMVFYQEIRPFFGSFNNVRYEGVDEVVRSYSGASAAQSSLIQFFDAIFGIDYMHKPSTQGYLLEMRKHMPPTHRAFLELVNSYYNFRGAKGEHEIFDFLYDAAVEQLIAFRNEHLRMVGTYIMKPARILNASSQGTGGTNPLKFLKSIRDRNKAQISTRKLQLD